MHTQQFLHVNLLTWSILDITYFHSSFHQPQNTEESCHASMTGPVLLSAGCCHQIHPSHHNVIMTAVCPSSFNPHFSSHPPGGGAGSAASGAPATNVFSKNPESFRFSNNFNFVSPPLSLSDWTMNPWGKSCISGGIPPSIRTSLTHHYGIQSHGCIKN